MLLNNDAVGSASNTRIGILSNVHVDHYCSCSVCNTYRMGRIFNIPLNEGVVGARSSNRNNAKDDTLL